MSVYEFVVNECTFREAVIHMRLIGDKLSEYAVICSWQFNQAVGSLWLSSEVIISRHARKS